MIESILKSLAGWKNWLKFVAKITESVNKDYIAELEKKNKLLEETISNLQSELLFYKNLISVKNIDSCKGDEEMKFLNEENFAFNEFRTLVKNNPKMVKMTMCDQIWQNIGPWSESRK